MSKARGLADLGNVYNDGALSNRNLIINGAMQVAQRGTSLTGISNITTHLVDRLAVTNSIGTVTYSQSTDAPSGFANSAKIEVTTANATPVAGAVTAFLYSFEGQDLQRLAKGTASAESVTVSFWVKSNKTGTYILEFDDNDNSRNINKAYTVDVSGAWEYKTITLEGDTSGAFDNDNGLSGRLYWFLGAGTNFTSGTLATSWEATNNVNRAVGVVNLGDTISNYFQITGVQLEVGDTATPFEHRSYGQELALCQRYYETTYPNGAAVGSVNDGPIHFRALPSGNADYRHFSHKVEKRASPTMIAYNGSTGASGSWRGSGGEDRTITLTSYGTSGFRAQGWSLGDYVQNGHFTADAEL